MYRLAYRRSERLEYTLQNENNGISQNEREPPRQQVDLVAFGLAKTQCMDTQRLDNSWQCRCNRAFDNYKASVDGLVGEDKESRPRLSRSFFLTSDEKEADRRRLVLMVSHRLTDV